MKLVAALVVLALAGCSFAFVPRVRPEERPVRCTTSQVAPAADGVIAAGAVGAAVIVGPCEGLSCLDRGVGVAALAAVALVYVVSAATGIARADSCARARAAAAADPLDLRPDD